MPKHKPERTCIITREKLPSIDLGRFVQEDGELCFDREKKLDGRGAHIKLDLKIFEKAVQSGAFNRALKANITSTEKAETDFTKYLKRKQLEDPSGKVKIRIKK